MSQQKSIVTVPTQKLTDIDAKRWQVQQRLKYLESRLFWDRSVNRQDLMDRFGISINQATHDFTAYLQLAPQNLTYSRQARSYQTAATFRSVFGADDAQSFLNELLLKSQGIMGSAEGMIPHMPPVATLGLPMRTCAVPVLRNLVKAIAVRDNLNITYQSMSSPQPSTRCIAPHALAWDGFRWHTRAWCNYRKAYIDFVLGRILSAELSGPTSMQDEDDVEWYSLVELTLAPHPGLSDSQRIAIEMDYGMTNGVLQISCRQAMLHYVKQRLGLDINPKHRTAQMQHIILKDEYKVQD